MSRLRLISEELRSFGSVVSIQGVRYLSDNQQGSLFRMIWLAIVAISFVVSGICIKNSIQGDDNQSKIVSNLNQSHTKANLVKLPILNGHRQYCRKYRMSNSFNVRLFYITVPLDKMCVAA